MTDRSLELIQRAAARLSKQAAAGAPPFTAPDPVTAPPRREELGVPARTSREIAVDRVRLAKAGISLPSDDRSRAAEEFRIIKRSVMSQNGQGAKGITATASRLILVTSARPLEGKTFVATNLALSIASEREYRTLLVDCDSARQSASKLFNIDSEPGFGDWLAGEKTEIADILLQTDIENFSLIPSGHRRVDAPEMLSSRKAQNLFLEMEQRYSDRYIVLDTPPVLAASDAAILAPLAGQIIFVVEAFRTQREEVEESLRLLKDCPRIGIVLNKSEGTISEQFGSYAYY